MYEIKNISLVCLVGDALLNLFENIFIRFDTKLHRKTVEIPMGTNCAPLVADFFCAMKGIS